MSMIQIREMTIEDCDAVADIDRACFTQVWSVAMFRDTLAFPAYFYVVSVILTDHPENTDEGRIVGFAGISIAADTADVINIGVLPEYRGQGIGNLLLQKLEELAKDNNCLNMMLEVRESNLPAIQMYHKHGFQDISVRKNYYSNPAEHGIVMQKLMNP